MIVIGWQVVVDEVVHQNSKMALMRVIMGAYGNNLWCLWILPIDTH